MKEITERTLKVENVSLGYGETTIVKDLSLEFPKGKITAIIGPNGCGKSTLLHYLYQNLVRRQNLTIGYMPQRYDTILPLDLSPIAFFE